MCRSSSLSFGDILNEDSYRQKLCYQTVDGSAIDLDVINHEASVCQEFIVTSPKFNYHRWLMWTLGFYAVGCIFQLHLQVNESWNFIYTYIWIVINTHLYKFTLGILGKCPSFYMQLCLSGCVFNALIVQR